MWQARREEVQAHADSMLARMMEKRNATDGEKAAIRAGMPRGISKGMVFLMGLLDGAAPFTRELLGKLDESDVRLIQMADANDLVGFSAEIGPSSELGPGFCEPLYVSGLTRLDLQVSEEERAGIIRTLTQRAHKALAFLAAVDQEIAQWNIRVQGFDAFGNLPRFPVLLVDPDLEPKLRLKPNDPIARLVDFVGAAGHRLRLNAWPDAPPTIASMGAQAELSGVVAGDGARFIRALRSGKNPMTRASFHLLVGSQISDGKAAPELIQTAEDFLEPYLIAAHLLTQLMAPHRLARGHLDRSGWRKAYFDQWARMVQHFPPVAGPPDEDRPPNWLFDRR